MTAISSAAPTLPPISISLDAPTLPQRHPYLWTLQLFPQQHLVPLAPQILPVPPLPLAAPALPMPPKPRKFISIAQRSFFIPQVKRLNTKEKVAFIIINLLLLAFLFSGLLNIPNMMNNSSTAPKNIATPNSLVSTHTARTIPTATPTSTKQALQPPTPTPPAQQLSFAQLKNNWSGQGTRYSDNMPFSIKLTISQISGNTFTGSMYENDFGRTIVIITGSIGTSTQFDPLMVQAVIQNYGQGTGTFLQFTDPSYMQGDQVALNCTYTLVLYKDQSLHGLWHYPGHTLPDGNLSFTRI